MVEHLPSMCEVLGSIRSNTHTHTHTKGSQSEKRRGDGYNFLGRPTSGWMALRLAKALGSVEGNEGFKNGSEPDTSCSHL
jgi:hypothetical protein